LRTIVAVGLLQPARDKQADIAAAGNDHPLRAPLVVAEDLHDAFGLGLRRGDIHVIAGQKLILAARHEKPALAVDADHDGR